MSDADPIGEDSGQRAEESASPRREPGEGPQRSWSRPALLGYALLAVSLVWLWQQGLASLAYQTIWVVGITFTLWFALVVRYSASRLAAFTFLTPLFGIAAGHLVMGDPITPPFAVAVTLVIAGLVLVNRR